MPDYTEIATVQFRGDVTDQIAYMPWDGSFRYLDTRSISLAEPRDEPPPAGIVGAYELNSSFGEVSDVANFRRVRDLYDYWRVSGNRLTGFTLWRWLFPSQWNFLGQVVNGEAVWAQVTENADLTDSTKIWQLRLAGIGAQTDGSNLIVGLGLNHFTRHTTDDNVPYWEEIGSSSPVMDPAGGSGVPATVVGNRLLDSILWDLQRQDLDDDTIWHSVLPKVASLDRRQIWVRADPINTDFQGLVIGVDETVQADATKSITLRTNYDPVLEDLDATIFYGLTPDGTEQEWSIASTERDIDELVMNLTARVIA